MKISRKHLNQFLPPAVSKIATPDLVQRLEQLGFSVASVKDLGSDETLLDLEITPNRGDCLSYLGVARELGAQSDQKQITLSGRPPFPAKCVAPDTPVFLLQGWQTPWNPQWKTPQHVARFLQLHDMSSIHPLVDIGNMIMLELGQPIHVYDLDKVQGTLTVRLSKAGEDGKTLSALDLKLTGQEVVIADDKKILCVGGVVGMQAAAIDHTTRRFAIEAAHFGMERTRQTCRKLQITTDASYRFERGVDPTLPMKALHRYASFIQQNYSVQETPKNFSLTRSPHRPWSVINTSAQEILSLVPGPKPTEAQSSLKKVGCVVTSRGKRWQVQVPPHRFDLKLPCDLSEEVARHYGYHRIPMDTHLKVNVIKKSRGVTQSKLRRYYRLSDRLVSLGYLENIHVSFISHAQWAARLEAIVPFADWVALENPLNQQRKHLPPLLFPLLVEQFQKMVDQHVLMSRIFEIGKTFICPRQVKEETRLALLTSFSGELGISHYRHPAAEPKVPYHEWPVLSFQQDIVSSLEEMGLSSTQVSFRPSSGPVASIFNSQGYQEIWFQDVQIGFIAQLSPQFDVFKKRKNLHALISEVSLDALQKFSTVLDPLRPPNIYPGVSRDVSVVLTSKISYAQIMQVVDRLKSEFCRRVQLIDTYLEDSGQLSLTFRMHYEDPNQTLFDETVNKWQEKFRLSLQQQCSVKYK